jgi:hypothetical protein
MNPARFLRSPLARHPGLLARKVVSRLGLYQDAAPLPTAPVSGVAFPDFWQPALRTWLKHVPLNPGPHPFHRIFGRDWDEGLLLRLSREGPRRGEMGLPADIKLAWDYSRGHALFLNAASGPAHLNDCIEFLRPWMAACSDTNGPTWSCAMEIAIRAVNWIFADVLFDGKLGREVGQAEWAAWLWRHGALIWRRLEARIASSNHYLADLLGLLVVGSIFPNDPTARRWRSFAREEFPRALLTQTRSDGGLTEASLRYHAYGTEMALLFRLAQGKPFAEPVEERLRAMCRIVSDFTDASGDVFAIGDDDSGRVLPLDFGSSLGRADIVLRLAASLSLDQAPTAAPALYPDSGWWVHRAGDFTAALDFGGVGLHGQGGHAHNDDFSFCLDWRRHSVITDPGTFLYTSDPQARNRFRSTCFHNTVAIDGKEQRELSSDVFRLPGSDHAFHAMPLPEQAWAFIRTLGDGLSHRRIISSGDRRLVIRDELEGSGTRELRWHFHLHPLVQARIIPRGFALVVPGAGTLKLETSLPSPVLGLERTEFSPGYGRSEPTFACNASGKFALPMGAEWSISPE